MTDETVYFTVTCTNPNLIPVQIETAGAAVSKRVVSTPANGEFYVKNETIQYEVVFQNLRGHELMNVKLTDPLIGSWVIGNAGQVYGRQTHVFSFSYKVQDKDVEAGFVSNTATVQWDKYKAGTKPQASTNTVTVACGRMNPVTISKTATSVTWQMDCGFPDTDGDGLPDIPFGVIHGLSVTKKEESLPLNGQYYVEGEVIHYNITYTNVGELPLIDVEIFDLMGGMTAIGSAEKLDSIVVPAEVNGVAVRGIEYMAFNMHKNFKHLTIADGAAMLDRRVLRDLLKLEAVELPGSLLVIREGNFTNLPMLTSVVIPANVVLVHSSFNKCASLASITFEGVFRLFSRDGDLSAYYGKEEEELHEAQPIGPEGEAFFGTWQMEIMPGMAMILPLNQDGTRAMDVMGEVDPGVWSVVDGKADVMGMICEIGGSGQLVCAEQGMVFARLGGDEPAGAAPVEGDPANEVKPEESNEPAETELVEEAKPAPISMDVTISPGASALRASTSLMMP